MKIQSDGKGYGKPENPTKKLSINAHSVFPAEDILKNNELFDAFDRDNPTLPIYLPNGEPYLGDDVVEGENFDQYWDVDSRKWKNTLTPGYWQDRNAKTRRIYRVHPVVTEQAEGMTIDDHLNRIKQIQFELAEDVREQARINIATMYRQCGTGYDENGNPIFDKGLLQEWFEKWHNKKDYNLYDTI